MPVPDLKRTPDLYTLIFVKNCKAFKSTIKHFKAG